MQRQDNTLKWLVITAIVVWAGFVLFWYVWFHPEHQRPYYHFQFLFRDAFIFLFVIAICFGIGRLILVRLLHWHAENLLIELLCSFAMGFALLSYTAMFLGFTGLLRFWVVIPVLIIYTVCGAFELKYFITRIFRAFPGEWKLITGSTLSVFLLVIILFQMGMNCIDSFTPPYEWDTLSYHLYCPKEYIKAGRIIKLPFIHQSYYACGVEQVYTLCLMLRSHIAPKLLHCFLGFMTLLLIYEMGRRLFTRTVALVAMVIFYTCPIPVWYSGIGKNDLGTVFFLTLAFYTFIRWWQETGGSSANSKKQSLLLSLFFTGVGIHIDYRGLIVVAVISLFLLYQIFAQTKERKAKLIATLMLFLLVPILIASPWYIRNYIYTKGGSPVYPFLVKWFGGVDGHYFDSLFSRLRQKYHSHPVVLVSPKSIWYYLSLPFWKFTILGRNYDLARFNAKVTPLYLILLPLFIFARKPKVAKELLALGLVYIVLTQAMRSNHTRYLAPIFPLLALVSAYVVTEGFPIHWKIVRRLLAGIVCLVVLALVYDNTITFFRHKSLEYVLGIINERSYITLRSEIYPASEFINTELPSDAKLLCISEERLYYIRRQAIPLTATRMARFIKTTGVHTMDEWKKLLAELEVTHILYNPGFHRRFEQVKTISDTVDEFFSRYKEKYLEPIYNRYGIEVYRIKEK